MVWRSKSHLCRTQPAWPSNGRAEFSAAVSWQRASSRAATETGFYPGRTGSAFCARIATGDYDAVIIGHSQFEKIPLSPEQERAHVERQLDDLELSLPKRKQRNPENFTIKQLESSKKKLEARLEKLMDAKEKDDTVTFEQLGVDRLFVDEADEFKNLGLFTKMRNVAGIQNTAAAEKRGHGGKVRISQ